MYYTGKLTNHGTITVGSNHPLNMTSATVLNASSGTISGNLLMDNGVFRQLAGSASGPIQLTHGSVLDLAGKGTGRFTFLGNGQLLGDILSGQQVTVDAATRNTSVTSPQSLTNAGMLTLLSTKNSAGRPLIASFGWDGELDNTGRLQIGNSSEPEAVVGRMVLRGADLNNSGTVSLLVSAKDATAGSWTSTGTVEVDRGATLSLPNSRFTQLTPGILQLDVLAAEVGRVFAATAHIESELNVLGDAEQALSYRVLTAPRGLDGTFDTITPSEFTPSYSPTAVNVFH